MGTRRVIYSPHINVNVPFSLASPHGLVQRLIPRTVLCRLKILLFVAKLGLESCSFSNHLGLQRLTIKWSFYSGHFLFLQVNTSCVFEWAQWVEEILWDQKKILKKIWQDLLQQLAEWMRYWNHSDESLNCQLWQNRMDAMWLLEASESKAQMRVAWLKRKWRNEYFTLGITSLRPRSTTNWFMICNRSDKVVEH